MSFSNVFSTVGQVLQIAIPAVQTAENFITGEKKGQARADAVISELFRRADEINRELKKLPDKNEVDLSSYRWIGMIGSPTFILKVRDLITAIVGLLNFVNAFDELNSVVPKDVN